ncbi:MAG: HD domain-containing protein [Bacilli bacterium]|nr:HD domain-containing protein [Bacilli bacterium]
MEKYFRDLRFNRIVDDILNNEKFKKTANYRHHGITRYEHSLKVAYHSYIIAKKLHLNYKAVARAGLLHDFFINEDLSPKKQKFSMFFHPYYSIENSTKYFELTDMEKDIIITHMFPTLPHKIPKYLESWLVSIVDKIVATNEFYTSYAKVHLYKLSNLYLVTLFLRK